MIFDFFKKLAEQRVTQASAQAKGKLMGAQAKAKGQAASKFNNAVDSAVKKGKGAAGGKNGKAKADGGKGMGWFGKGKGDAADSNAPEQPQSDAAFGDKTQFVQIDAGGSKACVGWVVALNGGAEGQDFRLVEGKNVIGTAADCDIVLPDKYMSARHAVLRYEEGTFVLVDLDSTNGTFVNEARASKEELIDNDRVRVGQTELKFKSLH